MTPTGVAVVRSMPLQLLVFLSACFSPQILASAESGSLQYAPHGEVNPFTGVVAWSTDKKAAAIAMEWAFIGLSDVLPSCNAPTSLDWSSVDATLNEHASRGHQTILRPVIIGPGYGAGSYAPADMPTRVLSYDGQTYANPRWDQPTVKSCVLSFIAAFALRYRSDTRVAYVQMGLFGLWGEHHLDDAAPYDGQNFPSPGDQAEYINAYLNGFGTGPNDISCGVSWDSGQSHGPFAAHPELLGRRFHIFDDSLLIRKHSSVDNWRQEAVPAQLRAAQAAFGMGGEFYWTRCNSNGRWATVAPYDCGNGESVSEQSSRLLLNYALGSPAVTSNNVQLADILRGSKSMGWELSATQFEAVSSTQVMVSFSNTGRAPLPYQLQACISMAREGQAECLELPLLMPGASHAITWTLVSALPIGSDTELFISLEAPARLPPSFSRPLLSNLGISSQHRDLPISVNIPPTLSTTAAPTSPSTTTTTAAPSTTTAPTPAPTMPTPSTTTAAPTPAPTTTTAPPPPTAAPSTTTAPTPAPTTPTPSPTTAAPSSAPTTTTPPPTTAPHTSAPTTTTTTAPTAAPTTTTTPPSPTTAAPTSAPTSAPSSTSAPVTTTTTPPPTSGPPRSRECCADLIESLGFKDKYGSPLVCSDSKWPGNSCTYDATYAEAEATCASVGARLCTLAELQNNEVKGTGCGMDRYWSWTSTTDGCDDGFVVTARGKDGAGAECSRVVSARADVRCCADACGVSPPLEGAGLLVPLYVYPNWWESEPFVPDGSWAWAPVINAAKSGAAITAIVNPDSGPGINVNSDYQQALFGTGNPTMASGGLVGSGASVLCYVATNYANKPFGSVVEEVNSWGTLYPGACDGFFFDQASTLSEHKAFYQAVHDYVKATLPHGTVVLNPGAAVQDESFYDIADTILSFENTCSVYNTDFVAPPGQSVRPSGKHAILAHECGANADVEELVQRAKQEGFGWMFFTDEQFPNIPVFWDTLVALV